MTVVLKLENGSSYHLDRSLNTIDVGKRINDARGKSKLLEFDDNRIPSRILFIDPDQVVSIRDDGHSY